MKKHRFKFFNPKMEMSFCLFTGITIWSSELFFGISIGVFGFGYSMEWTKKELPRLFPGDTEA